MTFGLLFRRKRHRHWCRRRYNCRDARVGSAVASVSTVFLPALEPKLCVEFGRLFSFEYFEIGLRTKRRWRSNFSREGNVVLPAGTSLALVVSSPVGPVSFTLYVPISSSKVVLIIRRLVPLVGLVM